MNNIKSFIILLIITFSLSFIGCKKKDVIILSYNSIATIDEAGSAVFEESIVIEVNNQIDTFSRKISLLDNQNEKIEDATLDKYILVNLFDGNMFQGSVSDITDDFEVELLLENDNNEIVISGDFASKGVYTIKYSYTIYELVKKEKEFSTFEYTFVDNFVYDIEYVNIALYIPTSIHDIDKFKVVSFGTTKADGYMFNNHTTIFLDENILSGDQFTGKLIMPSDMFYKLHE